MLTKPGFNNVEKLRKGFRNFSKENNQELCVLCGLCVRVCREAIRADAIGFIGRGDSWQAGLVS
jgi:NADH dehydrogenase/NADH:ubiquinone oxidoreductase subunit G